MGANSVRTLRITFQAPAGPGLYTFQAYIMNDSFVGTDFQQDIRVRPSLPSLLIDRFANVLFDATDECEPSYERR